MDFIEELYQLAKERSGESPDQSYTAKLRLKGRDKIAQKIGEEATELVIEAIHNRKDKIINESADLLYHLVVLWLDAGVTPEEIAQTLKQRQSQSGLEEKKNREK